MQKELITSKQGITIMTLFLFGSTVVVGSGGEAKQDTWIAILMGTLLFLPMILIYSKLLKMYPEKNLFEIIQLIFGSFFGKLIILLFSWYALHLGSLVIRNFAEFIQIVSLYETPQYIIIMLVISLSIYMVKSGIEVMGRWSEFFLPIIMLSIYTNIILAIKDMEFSNIKPILYNGLKPVVTQGFSAFTFPFAESVLFLFILSSSLKKGESYKKVFFISIIIASITFILVTFRNLFILGTDLLSTLAFPSYSAVRLINVGNVIQRIEITLTVIFLLSGLIKVSICLLTSTKGIAKIFNFDDYRKIIVPIALIMAVLATIIYESTNEMFEWLTIYPYYAIIFQVLLPIFILSVALLKKMINRESTY